MAKPENVRVYRKDTGETVHCELIHQGVDDEGMDNWLVAGVEFRAGLDELQIDVLPPMSGITFAGPFNTGFSMQYEEKDDDAG